MYGHQSRGAGEVNWEAGIDTHTLLTLHIKQVTDENLLTAQGALHSLCGDLNGEARHKEEQIHLCTESAHCAGQQRLTQTTEQ